MVKGTIKILNPTGLQLQMAGKLCDEAGKYKATVQLYKGNAITNAKSLLSVLAACIKCGDELELVCEGPDEQEAFDSITTLIEHHLGE